MNLTVEKQGSREEALEMMREGLAIQMYNELGEYSQKKKDVAWEKLQLLEKINELQKQLGVVEKQERLIEHEITNRKKMLAKLSRASYERKRGKEHDVSGNIS